MGGKTSAKAKNTWIAKAYDRINLTVPKGKKDTIQTHAEAQGESVNGFINRAIDSQISKDRDKGPSDAQQGPTGDVGISLHLEALQAAQEAAQKAGETVSQFVERAVSTQVKRDKTSLQLGINSATGGTLEKEA